MIKKVAAAFFALVAVGLIAIGQDTGGYWTTPDITQSSADSRYANITGDEMLGLLKQFGITENTTDVNLAKGETYAVLSTDQVLTVSTTCGAKCTGAEAVLLPAISASNDGQRLAIFKTETKTISLTPNGADSIGGVAAPHLMVIDGEQFIIQANNDSANWEVLWDSEHDHSADQVSVDGIGTPDTTQMQQYLDNTGSSGFYTGFTITDAGGGSINVASGSGFIRATASSTAPLLAFDCTGKAGLAIPSNSTRYIYIDYNAGSPQVVAQASEFLEAENYVLIGMAVNNGGSIETVFNLGVRLDESIGQAGRFLRRTMGLTRDIRKGGLIAGETGTRNVSLSTGTLWWGRTEYDISALDTSKAGSFDLYYRDGKSGFTQVASQTQWPNTQYDDGTGVLATMTNNKWSNLWLYIEPDGDVVMLYGRNQFNTSEEASLAQPPDTLPNRLSAASVLAARFTFQKSAATATISSAFDTRFAAAGATDHGNLAGLTDDDHTQYVLRTDQPSSTTLEGVPYLWKAWNGKSVTIANADVCGNDWVSVGSATLPAGALGKYGSLEMRVVVDLQAFESRTCIGAALNIGGTRYSAGNSVNLTNTPYIQKQTALTNSGAEAVNVFYEAALTPYTNNDYSNRYVIDTSGALTVGIDISGVGDGGDGSTDTVDVAELWVTYRNTAP